MTAQLYVSLPRSFFSLTHNISLLIYKLFCMYVRTFLYDVFVQWVETLDLVSSSLTEYDIAHCFLKTPKTFQVCMQLL